MEIENIIQYLLIGNLANGQIIYELKNTNELKIINDIKNLFELYRMKLYLAQQNINIESYYINISIEKLIMISKTNANFSIEQSFELFEKIKKNASLLDKYKLKKNKKNPKQSLESRITNIIYDFFQYINANKQIISEKYFQNKHIFNINIFNGENIDNKNNNKKIRINKLINDEKSKSIDSSKFSTRDIINKGSNIYENKLEQIAVNNKMEEEIDINDITKSFYKSRLYLKSKNNNNNNKITATNLSTNNFQKSTQKMSISKKIIMFLILCLIILGQIAAIPLIIINSYSY